MNRNKKLNYIGSGLLIIGLIIGIGVGIKMNSEAYAADSLQASNNEVITIGGTTDGLPVDAAASPQAYSGDGNVILFRSAATNLPDAGGVGGLYTYNIKTNTTNRVDISTTNVLPDAGLAPGRFYISESGRYVSFASLATNLIDGATKTAQRYYKRDVQAGVTTYVGGAYSGAYNQNRDRNLAISNDGRYALIASRYVVNSYPNSYGVVLGDGITGTYSWSMISKGQEIEGAASGTDLVGGLSCDGAFVAYQHTSNGIKLSDLRGVGGATVSAGGASSTSPIISCNGRYVLYATLNRTDITPTPSGMDTKLHLVRYDRLSGQRMYVDSNSSGTISTAAIPYSSINEAIPNAFSASIADTGDVVFKYNGYSYLKHLSDDSGTLEPIAKTVGGSSINVASGTLTTNGRYIFYSADPYDLGMASSPSSAQIIRVKTNL